MVGNVSSEGGALTLRFLSLLDLRGLIAGCGAAVLGEKRLVCVRVCKLIGEAEVLFDLHDVAGGYHLVYESDKLFLQNFVRKLNFLFLLVDFVQLLCEGSKRHRILEEELAFQ